jgi:uncharacterized repeat protein (TIGR01451 family)
VSHSFPSDLDVLLVGPQGQTVVLLSDAIGGGALTDESIVFSISATESLSRTGGLGTGPYKPTDYTESGVDAFGYGGTITSGQDLSVFAGADPNGDWSLYVADDADSDIGMIASGWSLSISTVEPAGGSAGLGVSIASATEVFAGSTLSVVVTVSNLGPEAATGVMVTNTIPSGFSLASASSVSQGSVATSGNNEIASLGTIASGGSATVTLNLQGDVVGPYTLVSSAYGSELDLNPSNNSASQPIRVNRVAMLMVAPPSGGSGFQLMLAAPEGVTYVIEVSSDLINWSPLSIQQASAGMLSIMDSSSTGESVRFYRAVEQ